MLDESVGLPKNESIADTSVEYECPDPVAPAVNGEPLADTSVGYEYPGPGVYVKIEDPDCIIRTYLNTNILVNAGPGTGKTHTVIERLAHIINFTRVDLGQVLVLCHTDATRDFILARLDEKGLSAKARQLVICTLDSLALNNLSEKTEDDLSALSYDDCVRRFNAEFDAGEWSDYEYVIIDELQDLVNGRAQMVLNILSALKCGYLLLGDRCQAIYDLGCDGEDIINSLEFYRQLNELLSQETEREDFHGTFRLELVGNHRQSEHLSQRSDKLRRALLERGPAEANRFFEEEIDFLPTEKFSIESFRDLPTASTAILTNSNDEAAWVSAKLRGGGIFHHLIQAPPSQLPPSFHRWLADMFWDYRMPRISRDDFHERYLMRVAQDEDAAADAYRSVMRLLDDDPGKQRDENSWDEDHGRGDRSYFEMKDLLANLKRGTEIPPALLNIPCSALTVSAIHRARGHEFDHVYLLSGFESDKKNTKEARVWYVGVNRAKSELIRLSREREDLREPFETDRFINVAKTQIGTPYIKEVAIGLPDDVDMNSFVRGDLRSALAAQEYIAKHVKKDDEVELHLEDKTYNIHHGGVVIGSLSGKAGGNIGQTIKSLFDWSDVPRRITNVYVSNICTVLMRSDLGYASALFNDSQLWLGVELSGFGEIDWQWGLND